MSLILATVYWWGLFGIFVETFWTLLRKFMRKAWRTPTLAPLARTYRRGLAKCLRAIAPLRRKLIAHFPSVAVLLGYTVKKRTISLGRRATVVRTPKHSPFSLHTETNGWTFIMFGTGMPLLISFSHVLVRHGVFRPLRFTFYALGFWGAELLWGTIIRKLGAHVPWDYSRSRFSAYKGLIRRDYFFAWGALGLLVEHFFSYWVNDVVVPATLLATQHMPSLFPSF